MNTPKIQLTRSLNEGTRTDDNQFKGEVKNRSTEMTAKDYETGFFPP